MSSGSAEPGTAAAMDKMYRRQRYIYDLTRKHYLLGRDRLIERLAAGPGMDVLEIGCGTARNLIKAARRYPGARFFGIDVSQEMLRSARRAIARAGLDDRIVVAQADATLLDAALFHRASFDRVFISYSLSMIPGWKAALDCAMAMVSPAGQLHVVDFGEQEGLPAWFRAALRRWLALFDVEPRDDLVALLEARAAIADAQLRVERPYLGYAQYAVLTPPPACSHLLPIEPAPSAAA